MSQEKNRSLSCLLLVPLFFLCAERASAQQDAIEIDADLDFFDNTVESTCYVFVGEDAPYSAYNGDCRLYRNHGLGTSYQEDLIAIVRRQNYFIGYPRDDDYTAWYYAVAWNTPPDVESVYCAKLGWDDGSGQLPFIFGHHSNSNLNLYLPTGSDCDSPSPRLEVFYQTECLGGYVQVYSIEFVEGISIFASFREISSPMMCYSIAVETSH